MTRRRFTAAALVAGAAFALLPATGASAYCDMTFHALTGHCNVCEVVRPDGPCPR